MFDFDAMRKLGENPPDDPEFGPQEWITDFWNAATDVVQYPQGENETYEEYAKRMGWK